MADEIKDDGGPAFPHDGKTMVPAPNGGHYHNTGMSLRDWFAGKALEGIVAAEADADGGGAFRITHKEIKFSTFVGRFADHLFG